MNYTLPASRSLHFRPTSLHCFVVPVRAVAGVSDAESFDRRMHKQLVRIQLERYGNHLMVEHAMKLLPSGHNLTEVTQVRGLSEGEVEILTDRARSQPAA